MKFKKIIATVLVFVLSLSALDLTAISSIASEITEDVPTETTVEEVEEVEEETVTEETEPVETAEEETIEFVEEVKDLDDDNRLVVVTDGEITEIPGAAQAVELESGYVLNYDTEEEMNEAIDTLSQMDEVLCVEEDAEFKLCSDDISYTHALSASAAKTGKTVALIDTGSNVADASYSVIDEDTSDGNGHGTAMNEAILETSSGSAYVLSVKALSASGSGKLSDVYAAFEYAVNSGAQIINMSITTTAISECESLNILIESATASGVTVVAAAGNNGVDAGTYFPASVDSVTTIGSCDGEGYLKSFSNYGQSVDLYAVSDSTSEAAAKVSGYLASGALESAVAAGDVFDALNEGETEEVQEAPASEETEAVANVDEDADDANLPYMGYTMEDTSADDEFSVCGTATQRNTIYAKAVKMIDVSSHNGSINWSAVKASGINYAIIRVGGRYYSKTKTTDCLYADSMLAENLKNAIAAGVKVGVYFFSQAVTEAEAIEEANYTINAISGYNITLPVYIDYEWSGSSYRLADGGSAATRTKVIKAFLSTVEAAGYDGGIYASDYTLYKYMDANSIAEDYNIWIAHWNVASPGKNYSGYYDAWQYGDAGSVSGISGTVDTDYWYIDNYYTVEYYNDDEPSPTTTKVAIGYDTETLTASDLGFLEAGYINTGWKAYREVDGKWAAYDTSDTSKTTCWVKLSSGELPEGYDYKIMGDGESVLNLAASGIVRFYAQKEYVGYFTVKYYDGDLISSEVTDVTYTVPTTTLTAYEAGFSDDGYVCSGWAVYREEDGMWAAYKTSDSSKTLCWVEAEEDGNLPEGCEYYIFEDGCEVSETATSGTVRFYAQWLDLETAIANANGSVKYRTHVQDYGWQSYVKDGAMSGTTGKSKRLEAINIQMSGVTGSISYSAHVQNIGWQDWVSDGALSGTSGKSLRLEAIKIKLTGTASLIYDVYYRVHAQHFGWLDWAKNGEAAGTSGYSYRLEAIQIVLVKKGDAAPGSTDTPYEASPVRYCTHIQDIGWQSLVGMGCLSGTTGKSKRLEGIKINLTDAEYEGSITYRTHVQNIGWQDWVEDGQMAGTSGKSLRLEAIQIKLTGEMAEHYDIYYRVHSQNYGWLGWAKNGESAGTAGHSYRLEAIEIVLVEKGGEAPGSTTRSFVG